MQTRNQSTNPLQTTTIPNTQILGRLDHAFNYHFSLACFSYSWLVWRSFSVSFLPNSSPTSTSPDPPGPITPSPKRNCPPLRRPRLERGIVAKWTRENRHKTTHLDDLVSNQDSVCDLESTPNSWIQWINSKTNTRTLSLLDPLRCFTSFSSGWLIYIFLPRWRFFFFFFYYFFFYLHACCIQYTLDDSFFSSSHFSTTACCHRCFLPHQLQPASNLRMNFSLPLSLTRCLCLSSSGPRSPFQLLLDIAGIDFVASRLVFQWLSVGICSI